MNRRSVLGISAVTVLAFSLLLDAAGAASKAKVSKKQLIGNWILVSNTNTAANSRPFGANDGYATFAVTRSYRRDHRNAQPQWPDFVCKDDPTRIQIGREGYRLSPDGLLMPALAGQKPPDLKYFK
jgi:hypothetical protein